MSEQLELFQSINDIVKEQIKYDTTNLIVLNSVESMRHVLRKLYSINILSEQYVIYNDDKDISDIMSIVNKSDIIPYYRYVQLKNEENKKFILYNIINSEKEIKLIGEVYNVNIKVINILYNKLNLININEY